MKKIDDFLAVHQIRWDLSYTSKVPNTRKKNCVYICGINKLISYSKLNEIGKYQKPKDALLDPSYKKYSC